MKVKGRATKITRMKDSAPLYTAGLTRMAVRIIGVSTKPSAPSRIDTATMVSNVCAATWSTMS